MGFYLNGHLIGLSHYKLNFPLSKVITPGICILAMVIVSATRSSSCGGHVSRSLRLRTFLGRPSRKVDAGKYPFKEVPGLCPEEPFCRSSAVSSLHEVIVDCDWGNKRSLDAEPTLPFCPLSLPDLPEQSNTFLESVLVANDYLKQSPKTSNFLEHMLQWSGSESGPSNWFKQSILKGKYSACPLKGGL